MGKITIWPDCKFVVIWKRFKNGSIATKRVTRYYIDKESACQHARQLPVNNP